MDDSFRNALRSGLDHVFSQLMSIGECRVSSTADADSGALVCCSLPIGGDWPGQVFLRTTNTLCANIVSLLFPDIAVSQDAIEDAACELLNMVAESARTLLSQRNLPFEVGAPSTRHPVSDILPEDKRIVRSVYLDEPIELWFEDDPGAKSAPRKDG